MTFSDLDPRTLTTLGTEGALEAAASPRASADLLSGLSAHPDSRVRSLVARHPNTPTDLLGALAAAYPADVLANPGLPLMRLARPNLLSSFPADSVIALLNADGSPGWVADAALRHEDYAVRTALAARPDLSEARVAALAMDAGWQIREAVARREDLPEPLARQLAADDDTTCARPSRSARTCPATPCAPWSATRTDWSAPAPPGDWTCRSTAS